MDGWMDEVGRPIFQKIAFFQLFLADWKACVQSHHKTVAARLVVACRLRREDAAYININRAININ